jgi:Family of unknown function (DUF6361)
MTSAVAWLDTDDDERRRMRELIAMFRDQGAVDELGMGRIRDAFSSRLFPGTSVLWSRARYLLFVPWIYNGLEDGAGAPGTAEDRARKLQKRLAKSLNARHGAGSGVIGASGADVRQPPDVILWAALGDWGIRLDPGRMSQVRDECVARSVRRSDLEGEFDYGVGLWHPVVNRLRPSGFPEDVSLDLTPAEAAFLAELGASADALPGTIAAARADSLLAQLVEFGCPTEVNVPWDHPAPTASTDLREAMSHAGRFSDAIQGARLLYALMVGEVRGDDDGFFEAAEAAYTDWATDIAGARAEELDEWTADLRPFWQVARAINPRIHGEMSFVAAWATLLRGDLADLPNDPGARRLIIEREHAAKGAKRARLARDGSIGRDARAVLPGRLLFRWTQAQSIARDIRAPVGH